MQPAGSRQSPLQEMFFSLVSGVLFALTLPEPGLCPFAWFALAPLLLAVREAASVRRAAALSWLAGAAFFAVSLHWIYLTCRFAGVPVAVGLLAWSALAAFMALRWALFGAALRWGAARTPGAAWPWTAAALWAALEFAFARFTPFVGADVLGYSQWRFLSWLQPSSVVGPHGLGFLIVLVNAALALWWMTKTREARRGLVVAAACALAWWAWGAGMLALRRAPEGLRQSVAILQPAIDQYRKWEEVYAEDIRAEFDGLLAEAAAAKPALIVWPETAVPGWLEEPENWDWVSGWAKRSGAYHLVGAASDLDARHHNAAVLVDPQGRRAGDYHKRQLVPFGEFVPFRRWVEPYIGILSQMGDFDVGAARQAPLASPVGRLGVTLCYEAVFPFWNRASVEAGAQVLANLTNDGWYKDTWAPYEHFHANVFRAIENRVTVIRSGNTGISAVIDPWGRVTAKLPLLERGVLRAEIPSVDPFPERSFYARRGDWFGWLCLGLCAALAASALLRRFHGA